MLSEDANERLGIYLMEMKVKGKLKELWNACKALKSRLIFKLENQHPCLCFYFAVNGIPVNLQISINPLPLKLRLPKATNVVAIAKQP